MKITTISTGSKGNAYSIDTDGEILLLECGIKFKDVLKAIDYRAGNVVGALVSHCHIDHDKYTDQYKSYGISVARPFDTEQRIWEFGKYKVQAVDVPHDGIPCYGFYIWHPKMGRLIYLTDLEYCKYTFPNIDYIMVECNYMDDFIREDDHNYNHRLKGHMSLDACAMFVKKNIHSRCKYVILIHASETAIDKIKALGRLRKYGKNIDFAEKGKVMEFN